MKCVKNSSKYGTDRWEEGEGGLWGQAPTCAHVHACLPK